MQTFFQDKQGRPLLVTGVQCHNSSTGSAMLQDAIKVAKEFQGNVLEAPVYWYLLEPEQGVYDTTHVRELIHTVREAGLHRSSSGLPPAKTVIPTMCRSM